MLNEEPMSDFAQTVKQQADIVKVIEGTSGCARRGRRTTPACARFTRKSRHRSTCMPGAAVLHCFGCGESGDVFSFVGKWKCGLSRAVRIVAEKCGIPLPKREFSSPEEAAGARLRRSFWICTRPRRVV